MTIHTRGTSGRRTFTRRALTCAALLLAGRAAADGCVTYAYDNGTVTMDTLWPNWVKAKVASIDVDICQCGFASERFVGLTVVNFGTATNGDFKGVYAQISCATVNTGLIALTYAGNYTEQNGVYPAWTWSGLTADFTTCAPTCVGCDQILTLDVYADLASCPTNLATVELGLPEARPATYIGGYPTSLFDNQNCGEGWSDLSSHRMTIAYVLKSGPDFAAPGDTLSYTVTYGRPGPGALTNILMTDTLPPYTHYVPGSASVAPDLGWDPNWGPPTALRWTLPGGAVTGGATGEMTFDVTVDWGNGEGFEPGSGDVAAPENQRLDNTAAASYVPTACAANTVSSAPARTSVRRYLFWKLGDNDLLLAPRVGLPDDEMTYSIFVKNVSASKIWWNVQVWDTVPATIDVWGGAYGFDDPCLGWTMTPGGCAAASPGRLTGGGVTLLTWKLDMPPQMTIELRWKGRVNPTATAGSTALNSASVMELGRSSVINGTGHAGQPRLFMHEAQILLRTTYFAYGAYGYQCTESTQAAGQALHIHFFPLNRSTNFTLYKQEHTNDVFANFGGVSPPIATFAGTCVGGFTDGGWPGCKAERIPAAYWPVAYDNTFPIGGIYPDHFLYKVISNTPFVWEMMTNSEDGSADRWGWVTGASLTFSARIHYSFMQNTYTGGPPGDEFAVINTSDTLPTTEILFRWNPVTLAWDYLDVAELDPGTIWRNLTAGTHNQSAPAFVWDEQSYRLVSSTTNTIVWRHLYNLNSQRGIMSPIGETGLLVSSGLPATFYAYPYRQGWTGADTNLAVMNLGATAVDYQLKTYFPVSAPYAANPIGSWIPGAANTVPAGIGNAGNPDVYGSGYLAGALPTTFGNPTPMWWMRVDQLTAGSLQVMMGADLSGSFSSGGILHDATGMKSGSDFWFSQTEANFGASKNCAGTGPTPIYTMDVFCPSKGMAPRMTSYGAGPGYDATYTTNALDEVVSFRALTGDVALGAKRNWRVQIGGPPSAGVVQWIDAQISEKYYTMPFVSQGVYYSIIAPPTAFTGQPFWITIIVQNVGGGTKIDYCGVTNFTSTDPGAQLQGGGMAVFDYTWPSNQAGGCNGGAGVNGVKVFVNVIFNVLGLQTIVANDTADGSITGLATVMVVGADVKLIKTPQLSIQASGDTVQFRVCWSNYSSASAFTFVITDAVPDGTTFLPEAGTAAFDCGNTTGVSPATAYSTSTSTTPPAAFTTGNPTAGTHWLRWTLPYAGVNTTGCVCYRVTVN